MHFSEMKAAPAVYDDVAREYDEIRGAFDAAPDAEGRHAAVRRWDDLRRRIETWGALVHTHFTQDTRDEVRRKAREAFDEQKPAFEELSVAFMDKLLESPHREELEQAFGRHAFDLWDAQRMTFDPAIKDDLVRESKLTADYTALLARAALEFDGETQTLSMMRKYGEHPDRAVRRAADKAVWGFFVENAAELDRIYDDLVKLRHKMARTLGFDNYLGFGYKRLHRTDYGVAEVEAYRDAVRKHVVPLAARVRERQRKAIGVDTLMNYDEALHDPAGNPKPGGGHDWMLDRAGELFDDLGGGLGEFWTLMRERGLLDLGSRPGKAGGGYCTSFTTYEVPFIFANFNGTQDDVRVFTHEMGHAFQCYSSRNNAIIDLLWPTAEACEIHSMSLEYLTWPQMGRFFGDDADRFRTQHLTGALLFLPYGAAIDHFQHLVYENPDATPEERHGFWKRMEETYLPWRQYDDEPHAEKGALWQRQLHVYCHALYYIDYTLAEACALQFWLRSRDDPDAALADYVALCRRGGEAPFRELLRDAGLKSPFAEQTLADVVHEASSFLKLG